MLSRCNRYQSASRGCNCIIHERKTRSGFSYRNIRPIIVHVANQWSLFFYGKSFSRCSWQAAALLDTKSSSKWLRLTDIQMRSHLPSATWGIYTLMLIHQTFCEAFVEGSHTLSYSLPYHSCLASSVLLFCSLGGSQRHLITNATCGLRLAVPGTPSAHVLKMILPYVVVCAYNKGVLLLIFLICTLFLTW